MLGASKAVGATVAVQTYGVFITPSSVSKISPAGAAITPNVLANVTGGVGAFTYSWVRISGSPEITATDPTLASTAFAANGGNGDEYMATFEVTVTDLGNGSLQVTDQINVIMVFGNL